MNLLQLSPEIHIEILQFCSPSDLASLSRVHTSLRDVAEDVLYGHIYFKWPITLKWVQNQEEALREHRSLIDTSLMDTLTRNSRQVAMVKSLHVEIDNASPHPDFGAAMHSPLVRLSHSLENLSYLVDLRIIYHPLYGDPSVGQISRAIRDGHFQLHTLWLGDGHDLVGILAGQPSLRFLGIHSCYGSADKQLWTDLKRFFRTPMPTICMMKGLKYWNLTLEIFPRSHRPGEALRECREIIRSLHELYYNASHLTFNLFGITEEHINLLAEVTEGIAISFSDSINLMALEISIYDATIQPWRSAGFIRALPLLETVKNLNFIFPDLKGDEVGPFVADMHKRLVKDLGKAWPKVQRVSFRVQRPRWCMVLQRESDWTPFSSPFAFWNSDDESSEEDADS